MKITFNIDYRAAWGQTLYICGSDPALGAWDESKALELSCFEYSKWIGSVDIKENQTLEYYYLVKDNGATVRKEWGTPRCIDLKENKKFLCFDYWIDTPPQEFLYTSAFSESFFAQQPKDNKSTAYPKKAIILKVNCPHVNKQQDLILCGALQVLGGWNPADAIALDYLGHGTWQTIIDASKVKVPSEYKLAIRNKANNQVSHWEYGSNRILSPLTSDMKGEVVNILSIDYRYGWMNWKASGVSIPVFSLRSEDSFGCGEFSDLNKLIDWTAQTGQKVIQVLPINDTTTTRTWRDSYPYSAISIYALHPIYLGLKQHPLKDKKQFGEYAAKAKALNDLPEMDYEKVLELKTAYIKSLFAEKGEATLKSKSFIEFFAVNREWLFPYACFSYLRDKYKSPDFSLWGKDSKYDNKKLKTFIESQPEIKSAIDEIYFVQYLLHTQLLEVKEYAHKMGVILKGDIPIGIGRNSVEAWVEPHFFNMDTQTGAPPDDFSVNGQNWGFPTYNWDEMKKDGFQWWIKRFKKMSDYFDAYRIDHILGFFRIWEIPLHSVQGLLGYFSPALPFSVEEIRYSGMWFDEYRMTNPYIHEHFLGDFFGEYTKEVIDTYLSPISWQRYELKEFCDTQQKIKALFEDKTDAKSTRLRDGLYGLCNEVLFVRDKREPHKFHPRITAQYTYSFKDLDNEAKDAYNRLYNHFFFYRHSQFWRDQAMEKLPTLISSTQMLVCGEDLGMIPDCVSSVMNELQILSLEIQRMPKSNDRTFENLSTIPYRSVCTTSTHDMAPIRAWWKENRAMTQQYYNQILWKHGAAPEDCDPDLCYLILNNHLKSPAMLTVLPLQDWLSMDGRLRLADPDKERINIPAIAQHYWRYRMHLSLEELLKADTFNQRIKTMLSHSGR